MRVIYKTSMVDRIYEKIYGAKINDKEIDKIILTPEEWKDLDKELQLLCPDTVPYYANETFSRGGPVAIFKGIPIFVQ